MSKWTQVKHLSLKRKTSDPLRTSAYFLPLSSPAVTHLLGVIQPVVDMWSVHLSRFWFQKSYFWNLNFDRVSSPEKSTCWFTHQPNQLTLPERLNPLTLTPHKLFENPSTPTLQMWTFQQHCVVLCYNVVWCVSTGLSHDALLCFFLLD